MLNITLLCVGKLKEPFYTQAAAEYAKRLSAYCKLSLVELPEERLPKDPSQAQIDAALAREADAIRAKLPPRCGLVALCVEGRMRSSEELAGLTRALKEFAMRRGVAVVELVQAARESEGRRMGLRDMFGSATIEQDADGVLALEPQGEGAVSGEGSRDVRVSVLKWREGVACELRFAWQPQFHRFWPAGP